MKKVQFVLAALMFAGAASANASVLLANDSFNITNITRTNANSVKNDNGGDGWAGSWQTQMTAATAPQLVAAKNMEGATALEFTKDSNQAAFRLLEDPISGDVLVDFLIQVSGTPKFNTFVGLWFGNYDGPSFGLKTDCGQLSGCNQDFFARTVGQGGPFIPNGVVTAGETYHLFAHLYKSKGSSTYNSLDAWLNPTAAEMRYLTTPDLHTTGASSVSSFDTIGFRTVNFVTGVSVRVDALNIATIPEPGSLALMGLSAMGLGVVRRRKQGLVNSPRQDS
jgi:hypothetical protein